MFLIKGINKFPVQNKQIFSLVNELFSDEIQNTSLKDLGKRIGSIFDVKPMKQGIMIVGEMITNEVYING